jgi:hypothetical protein
VGVRSYCLGVLFAIAAACGETAPKEELPLDAIKVEGAHMRTDTVGVGQFEENATFVLVDARNTADKGAYVTLAGELLDASGTVLGELRLQSLWIPAGELRTFALVDSERKPRPTAKSARAKVRGAVVLPAPVVHVEELHTFDVQGQLVLQAYIVNDAVRSGTATVIATFRDAANKPLTRPFSLIKIGGKTESVEPGNCPDADEDKLPLVSKCPIRFVGPPGAKTGTIYIGDVMF